MNKEQKYLVKFNEIWSDTYALILKKRKEEHFVFCNNCRTDVSISHSRENDINKHVSISKHKSTILASRG